MTLASTLMAAIFGIITIFRPFPPINVRMSDDELRAMAARAYGIYECSQLRAANCIEGFQPYCYRHMRGWDADCVSHALGVMKSDWDDGRAILRSRCHIPCKQDEGW